MNSSASRVPAKSGAGALAIAQRVSQIFVVDLKADRCEMFADHLGEVFGGNPIESFDQVVARALLLCHRGRKTAGLHCRSYRRCGSASNARWLTFIVRPAPRARLDEPPAPERWREGKLNACLTRGREPRKPYVLVMDERTLYCSRCGTAATSARCAVCSATILDPDRDLSSPIPTPPTPTHGKSNRGGTIAAVIGSVALLFYGIQFFTTMMGSPATTFASSSALTDRANSAAQQFETGGSGCSPSDFKIAGLHESEEDGIVTIVGMLKNNCNEAAGAQLKIVLFDKHGDVVDTSEPWPASISNISAHDSYAFKAMMPSPSSWEKYSVHVQSVKRW